VFLDISPVVKDTSRNFLCLITFLIKLNFIYFTMIKRRSCYFNLSKSRLLELFVWKKTVVPGEILGVPKENPVSKQVKSDLPIYDTGD